jgi:hypothetical protein
MESGADLVAVDVPQATRLTIHIYGLPDPGSAILRYRSASLSAGVTLAIVVYSLFFQPVTTSASPCIIASKAP